MPARIDPSARIDPEARLGENVEVGAYAFVGAGVMLGDGTRLHHHASVEGNTQLGRDCEVFPFASIGARTQDLKFKGGSPGLRVGDRNIFREYVSVHCATKDGDFTVLGDDNAILASSHVAHDCVLGSHIVLSNGVQLAGHVVLEDHVVIGGYGGVHQFCRLGAHAMLAACAKLVHDLPPYLIADGTPATIRAVNKVGLERRGLSPEAVGRIREIHKILYRRKLNRSQALEQLAAHPDAATPEYAQVIAFARASKRGLAPGE